MMTPLEDYKHIPLASKVLCTLLFVVWAVLFAGGLVKYTGSSLTYTLFSFVFLVMLLSGLIRQSGYGYLFLVIMLWLGFWLKVTVHLWIDYPFRESIGAFDNSGLAWDAILRVASMGALGVIVGRSMFLFSRLAGVSQPPKVDAEEIQAPQWYAKRRRALWIVLLLFCFGAAIFNASLGIMQVGLAPQTILPWPMNALVAWVMGSGLTLAIATLLWWDILLKQSVTTTIYSILAEGFLSTVSMLSRGVYIFHVMPQLFALFRSRATLIGWSKMRLMWLGITLMTLFLISNPLVNALRGYYYSNVPLTASAAGMGGLMGFAVDRWVGAAEGLMGFAVDRWVGAEGLMVVQACPDKGDELFLRGLQERREVGKDTLYVTLSQPKYYGVVDKTKFEFTEIPGAMAFFYYSGKVWIEAMGMIVLTLLVLGSERLVMCITSNPVLCALWGMMTANAVAQFGVAPRSSFTYILETVVAILLIGLLQSKLFVRLALRTDVLLR